jgi:hypothetical protein
MMKKMFLGSCGEGILGWIESNELVNNKTLLKRTMLSCLVSVRLWLKGTSCWVS